MFTHKKCGSEVELHRTVVETYDIKEIKKDQNGKLKAQPSVRTNRHVNLDNIWCLACNEIVAPEELAEEAE